MRRPSCKMEILLDAVRGLMASMKWSAEQAISAMNLLESIQNKITDTMGIVVDVNLLYENECFIKMLFAKFC